MQVHSSHSVSYTHLPEVNAHKHDETCYILVPTVDLEEENNSDDSSAADGSMDITDGSMDITDDSIGNDAVTDNTDIDVYKRQVSLGACLEKSCS